MQELTPKKTKALLDEFVIGQEDGKKMLSIALHARNQRLRVKDKLFQEDIRPKNILMIGPTGSGKTEIARRVAKIVKSPFIKTEATSFTETGYKGREVVEIIHELAKNALSLVKKEIEENNQERAREAAINQVMEHLLPTLVVQANHRLDLLTGSEHRPFAQMLRKRIESGELNDFHINMNLPETDHLPDNADTQTVLKKLTSLISKKHEEEQSKTTTIAVAIERLTKSEALSGYDEQTIKQLALKTVQERGIVFIDEIDKTIDGGNGNDFRQGVQRDLLTIIEGTEVKTELGLVKTDHILFICAGAFHLAEPSDLLPEFLGRLPIKVQLKPLTKEEYRRILTEPKTALLKQYVKLLETDKVELIFTESAIDDIANLAFLHNENENLGARRLQTIMEHLMLDVNFELEDLERDSDGWTKFEITSEYVKERFGDYELQTKNIEDFTI